jgi:RNA polymerase sigma factor (sigma-70 family)
MALNDSEMIARSVREPEAFGAIFDRHFDAIAGFCIRRIGVARGEDVAGDVFRWAFEHRQRFDLERGDARPWLFGIASNLVRESLRSAGRQQVAYDRWLGMATDDEIEIASLAAANVDAQDNFSSLVTALRRQPIEEVETLLLFAWEQLTYAQIAATLDIPVGTVRSRIHRIRQRLQESLDDHLVSTECPPNRIGGSL